MGNQIDVSGPWDYAKTSTFLNQAEIPIRVASSGSRGPIVQSLWFDFDDDALWCATQASSILVKRLTANNEIGFEVSGDLAPYSGVRGTGVATIHPELAGEVLQRLIKKYQGEAETDFSRWLLSRLDKEVAVKITALTLTSWDFTGRMGESR